MWTKRLVCALWLCAGNAGGGAWAQTPLSAIDWLEAQTESPGRVLPGPGREGDPGLGPRGGLGDVAPVLVPPLLDEPPVSQSATTPRIEVTALDAPEAAAVGLLPGRVTGLPSDLWAGSDGRALSAQLAALDLGGHPALLSLLYTLLLAEADAPRTQGSAFLSARIRTLMELGATEPARALVERAGTEDPARFDLWFDLSLLGGDAEAPCAALRRSPRLSGDIRLRIFCAARQSDWSNAVTMLQTAEALDDLTAAQADLLARFLDPELAEELPAIPPPSQPDVLDVFLHDAIGEPLATATLPRLFAVRDLGGDNGWKPQLEAAERLTAYGAISENRWLGIYSAHRRAASGGVWDRVDAVQRFDRALRDGSAETVARTLQAVWPQMKDAGLAVAFADVFGPQLRSRNLTGGARVIAAQVGLLSADYEAVAADLPQDLPRRGLLSAIATGEAPVMSTATGRITAIAAAFRPREADPGIATRVRGQQLGAVILETLALVRAGAEGDPATLTRGLSRLRALGLEDTARRAALQILLLDPRT